MCSALVVCAVTEASSHSNPLSGGLGGGGVIQGTASESTHMALLAAKAKSVAGLLSRNSHWKASDVRDRLVVYASEQVTQDGQNASRVLDSGNEMSLGSTYGFLTLRDRMHEVVRAAGVLPIGSCRCKKECFVSFYRLIRQLNELLFLQAYGAT